MKTLRGLAFRLFKSNKFIVFSSIIMLLIYKYIPAENGFLVIVLFPLIYWFIYEFILRPKKRRSND
ncbi:hypothetical protein EMIT0180MI3_11730 [Priestia megaterium]|jgi:hypothetical protein|nr:hypothetical protein [Priestia megaterium]